MEILAALLVMGGLALVSGMALHFAALHFQTDSNPLVDQVDAILPQTQCGQCGYPGCRPYAQAIVEGGAEINQCPPGGETGIKQLASLLGKEVKPLNAENGVEKPAAVAVIDEDVCIGCTLCIQACPVDAIVGAAKQMHTVLEDLCTGCELCIPPCPVDCIVMQSDEAHLDNWKWKYPVIKMSVLPNTQSQSQLSEG